jgi:hypothetical protein
VSELNDSVELSPVAFGRSGDVVRLLVCPWRHYTPWPDRLAPLSACPSRIASTPEGWYRCGKALAATGVTYQPVAVGPLPVDEPRTFDPQDCPGADTHGNPFRYCPVKDCGWHEGMET